MVRSAGSRSTVQTSWKRLLASRLLSTTLKGRAGRGKRRDSSKVRADRRASAVVSHSPATLANPREYSSFRLSRSSTSKRYLPRPV